MPIFTGTRESPAGTLVEAMQASIPGGLWRRTGFDRRGLTTSHVLDPSRAHTVSAATCSETNTEVEVAPCRRARGVHAEHRLVTTGRLFDGGKGQRGGGPLPAKRTGTGYPELLPQRILAQRILTSLSLTAPAFWSPRPGCPRGREQGRARRAFCRTVDVEWAGAGRRHVVHQRGPGHLDAADPRWAPAPAFPAPLSGRLAPGPRRGRADVARAVCRRRVARRARPGRSVHPRSGGPPLRIHQLRRHSKQKPGARRWLHTEPAAGE